MTSLAADTRAASPTAEKAPLLEIDNLRVYFPIRKGLIFERTVAEVKAVDGVSFSIRHGETLGLVGESGCGKTTVARTILKLERLTGGNIRFEGTDMASFDAAETVAYRRQVQAIFQDPYGSLNPRMTVADIVSEPLIVHRTENNLADRQARVRHLLEIVGLAAAHAERYPHEMSGGQRQRVGIARALALNPEFIVCDEAVSALDVSIQAQIIRLLESLRQEFGLTYLFIGHDLSVVRHLCDRVAVMYLGKLVEIGDSDSLFASPQHPYTKSLLAAVPVPDPDIEKTRAEQVISGEVPSPMNPPKGCVFHTRCNVAVPSCGIDVPPFVQLEEDHAAACTQIM
jgi:oligopeptide transport system ATP-binding protein